MNPVLALIRHYEPEAPLLYLADGTPLSQAEFTAQTMALAQNWPSGRAVINLCEDRYRFLLALAAAMLRGALTLMPPSRGAEHLAELRRAYPDAEILGDFTPPQAKPWNGAPPNVHAHEPLLAAFTSGSTGTPRANFKTWSNLTHLVRGSTQALGIAGQRINLLATVPTQHMYGLETVGLMPLIGQAASSTLCPFYPADIADALQALPAPRMLVSTPLHLRTLAGTKTRLPPLEGIISATAPLERELAIQVETALSAPILEIYGCSETGSIATRRTSATQTWTLYEGVKLHITPQRVTVTSPGLIAPFELQDRIELAGENRFRMMGRSGDLINVGGKRCSLAELTNTLQSISGVEDGIVFLPNTSASRPAALVVAPSLNDGELRAALARRIDTVFLPRPLRRVAKLPRNEVGKLPHAKLVASLEASR